MVSIGTIISLGIVGAAIVGGYAVYRNFDKIGGALSRGVETNITNPVGNYFDSLWQTAQSSLGIAQGQKGQGVNPSTIFDPLPSAYGAPGAPPLTQPQPTPVPQYNNPYIPPSYQNPPASNLPNPLAPIPKVIEPTKGTSIDDPSKFLSGYYYVNYSGAKYDTQWKLDASKASDVARAASAPGDAFLGIKYIGQTKLGEAGFELFGRSQNYL